MDTSSSVGSFSEKVRTSQPSLTKRGLTLQVKNDNPLSREDADFRHQIIPPPVSRYIFLQSQAVEKK